MMKRASSYLVPFTLGATGLVLLCLVGCDGRKDSAPANASPAAVESRMADPVYRQNLEDQLAERNQLSAIRGRLVEKMEAMIEAQRKSLPMADDAALKAALEKDPEWRSLYAKVVDVNVALEDNRKKSLQVVRDRIKGK